MYRVPAIFFVFMFGDDQFFSLVHDLHESFLNFLSEFGFEGGGFGVVGRGVFEQFGFDDGVVVVDEVECVGGGVECGGY